MKRIFSGVAMEQDPTGGSCPSPPPLGPPGGLTGTGGWTGPQVLGGPPEALNLRFSRKPCRGSQESPGVPQRPRGGGVREKDPGPPEGPGRSPGAWGSGLFCFVSTEGPNGLPCPGPAGPRAPPGPQPWGPGGPGVHFPHDPGGPPGHLRPSGTGGGTGNS